MCVSWVVYWNELLWVSNNKSAFSALQISQLSVFELACLFGADTHTDSTCECCQLTDTSRAFLSFAAFTFRTVISVGKSCMKLHASSSRCCTSRSSWMAVLSVFQVFLIVASPVGVVLPFILESRNHQINDVYTDLSGSPCGSFSKITLLHFICNFYSLP